MQSYSNLSCGCLWSFLYNKVRCWVTDAGLKQEWEFVYLKPYLRSDVTSACSEPQINVGVALSVAYPFFWQDNGDQSTLVWFISAYFPFDSSQRMTSLCAKKKKKRLISSEIQYAVLNWWFCVLKHFTVTATTIGFKPEKEPRILAAASRSSWRLQFVSQRRDVRWSRGTS